MLMKLARHLPVRDTCWCALRVILEERQRKLGQVVSRHRTEEAELSILVPDSREGCTNKHTDEFWSEDSESCYWIPVLLLPVHSTVASQHIVHPQETAVIAGWE